MTRILTEMNSSSNKPHPERGTRKKQYRIYIIAIVASFLVTHYAITAVRITGKSMEPELWDGDWVLVDRTAPYCENLCYGDIIVFSKPEVTSGLLIKRIIGLPGDLVEVQDGTVYINGDAAKDGYQIASAGENRNQVIVCDGCFYVLGDNRDYSSDSRSWLDPLVQRDACIGKVCFVFPLHTFLKGN